MLRGGGGMGSGVLGLGGGVFGRLWWGGWWWGLLFMGWCERDSVVGDGLGVKDTLCLNCR